MSTICFSFPDDEKFGRALAAALGAEHGELDLHRFPDGETLVRLRSDCANRSVIFVCGGHDANGKALPLQFAAAAARSMRAA